MRTSTRLATTAAAFALTAAGSVAGASAASADSFVHFRNAAFSQCVDAPGGGLNVRLKLSPCSTSATQRWVLVPTGAPNTFFIVNKFSGFCMEVNNGTSNPGETVDEFFCNGQASEQWVVEGLTLRHLGTNQCLDTVGGPGSELMQFTCGQARPPAAQSWVIE